MKNPFNLFSSNPAPRLESIADYWSVSQVSETGILSSKERNGFLFEADGIDGSFLAHDQLNSLNGDWRSVLRLEPQEELQIILRKRVEFSKWIEEQLAQSFLSENPYGKKILLDRLADKVTRMREDRPHLLSQKIIICFWTAEPLDEEAVAEKRNLVGAQLRSFGFKVQPLDKNAVEREMHVSCQDLGSSENQEPEWPSLNISPGQLTVNSNRFRALELSKLPESFSELGMIRAITSLPYSMDVCLRLRAKHPKPIVARLERKRNLLSAQRSGKNSPSPNIENQISQIDQVLRGFAARSESIFDMQLVIGLRAPPDLASFQRKALANVIRAGAKMDFCEFEETTLSTFDAYLETIPSFSGKNIRSHTILGSNAIHFLPFFRPAVGDRKQVASFETRDASIYGIDPLDQRLANYNWLVSGTSGAGKSFFVNSLLAQSSSLNPNIFIVDIGGSYNKLTRFLGGRVMSLEPGQGFELSPFFISKSGDPKEERLRRQHIFNIFLEMTRVDGQLPTIEIRHLLLEKLELLLDADELPERPISYLIEQIRDSEKSEAIRLRMLLQPWAGSGFFAQFVDNNKVSSNSDRILTFDLKGLTEFADLSRVIQLIVCASLWARVRQAGAKRFSWIVLDEVAFSLLKTQPEFVDELVSTLRKYFAGAVIVVQDLEKITSNAAGSSILQNTQSKAILQQRGDPRNYSAALSLSPLDLLAIESLRREKGAFSDIFLIRDDEKTVVRHAPSSLEYWLSTTAPEDTVRLQAAMNKGENPFQEKLIDFSTRKREAKP